MDKFNLIFEYSEGLNENKHSSYLMKIKEKYCDIIEQKLLKAGYEPNDYIVKIILHKEQHFPKPRASLYISRPLPSNMPPIPGSIPVESMIIGSIDISFWDKEWGAMPKVTGNKFTWSLDLEKDISDHSIAFKIEHIDNFTPPTHVLEKRWDEQARKFVERLEKGFRFPVELIGLDYPDVLFKVYFPDAVNVIITEQTETVFYKFMEKYNKRKRESDNEIHHVNNAGKSVNDPEPNAVYMHVDFGNCYITALLSLLRHLDKSDLNIEKVILL